MKITVLDREFGKLVRLKRGYMCERCGKHYPEGGKGLHISHFIGRSEKHTRWYEDNVDLLCYGCHSYLETHKPTLYRDWKREQLGERFNALIKRSHRTDIVGELERKEIREKIKGQIKEIV